MATTTTEDAAMTGGNGDDGNAVQAAITITDSEQSCLESFVNNYEWGVEAGRWGEDGPPEWGPGVRAKYERAKATPNEGTVERGE